MKNQMKLLFVLLSLFLISCASSSQQTKKQSIQKKKLNDRARTYDIVRQGVATIYPELKEVLSKIATIYSQRDTVSIKMLISPAGTIDLIGFVDKIKLNPGVGSGLQNFFFWQVIDSTRTTEKVTKVVVHSYMDANNSVALAEHIDADYVEIRDRSKIILVIDLNRRDLRRLYSKRWAENNDLAGSVSVRFGINDLGDVVFCNVVKSTMNDPVFEKTIVSLVSSWKFGEIDNPGDVTEVVYPFTFNQ